MPHRVAPFKTLRQLIYENYIPREVLRDRDLSYGAKHVYGIFAAHAIDGVIDPGRIPFPRHQRAAEYFGLEMHIINGWIWQLFDRGYLYATTENPRIYRLSTVEERGHQMYVIEPVKTGTELVTH